MWSALEVVVRQGVLFAVSIILARLISPGDFGTIAIITFFTNLTAAIVQSGLATALVQRQDTSYEEECAVFWCIVLGSVVLAASFVGLSGIISRYYGYPVLHPLMNVAALLVLLTAGGATHVAVLTRRLRFDLLTKVGVSAALGGGVAGIVTALSGAGVWALVIQLVVGTSINTIALWWLVDWRPSLRIRLGAARRLFSFGGWVSLGNLLDTLYTQGFALLIGKLHGLADVGHYNRAVATQALPSTVISSIITRVALPLFAARKDPDGLRRGLRLAIGISMLVNFPAMIGLSLLSKEVIGVLFGDTWLPAAPVLSLLAIAGATYPVHAINVQLTLAVGNTSTFIRLELIKKLVGLGLVVVGSFFGVIGLAASQVAFSFLALIVNTRPPGRAFGYGTWRQIWDLAGLFFITAIMGAVIMLLKTNLGLPPLPTLVICTISGSAVFFLTAWATRLEMFREAFNLVAEARAGRRPDRGVGWSIIRDPPPTFDQSL